MKIPRWFYLLGAVVGTLIPWWFFGSFIAAEGFNLGLFVSNLFANGPAGGFSADVLISATVFLVWSFADSKEKGVKNWWVLLPATFGVGLSLALPLYMYMRSE